MTGHTPNTGNVLGHAHQHFHIQVFLHPSSMPWPFWVVSFPLPVCLHSPAAGRICPQTPFPVCYLPFLISELPLTLQINSLPTTRDHPIVKYDQESFLEVFRVLIFYRALLCKSTRFSATHVLPLAWHLFPVFHLKQFFFSIPNHILEQLSISLPDEKYF